MATATATRSSGSSTAAARRVRPSPGGSQRLTLHDYSHKNPKELLEAYWNFVTDPLAGVAAMLVSTIGESTAAPNVTGDLLELVQQAGGLQKAHGRNIQPEVVGNDLEMSVPSGFTPTFALYLAACGIRPDTEDDRQISRQIKTAIKRKIKQARAGPGDGQ